jgi:pyruvate/2-oxoacid:ferredoxin oxidoreductase beta subunit
VEFEVLISGIGGQGIQLVAKSMALAAMAEGRMPLLTSEVSGAMRGGHSLAAVVIGDGPLKGLPVVTDAAAAIVFHPMLWDDVARRLQPGATVVANANLVHLDPSGGAIELWEVLATELASGLGSLQVLGFIMLGAFAGLTGIVAIESLVDAMTEMRMRPECAVFTLTGDGDMVNEGLQEVLHTAARGEAITSVLLNNGVFGDTGGQMTTTTVVGQRTKTSLEGRDPEYHGYPIPISDLISRLDGVAYVARGAVHAAGLVARTKRMLRRAFEIQMRGDGFTFVEILTMCPTGWFVGTLDGPDYLTNSLEAAYPLGELKQP